MEGAQRQGHIFLDGKRPGEMIFVQRVCVRQRRARPSALRWQQLATGAGLGCSLVHAAWDGKVEL